MELDRVNSKRSKTKILNFNPLKIFYLQADVDVVVVAAAVVSSEVGLAEEEVVVLVGLTEVAVLVSVEDVDVGNPKI